MCKKKILSFLSLVLTVTLFAFSLNLVVYAEDFDKEIMEPIDTQNEYVESENIETEISNLDKTPLLEQWIEDLGLTMEDLESLLNSMTPTKLSLELRRLSEFREYLVFIQLGHGVMLQINLII